MFREEKRLVSMLLCIALLLSMMPMAVFAQGNSMSVKIEASATEVCVGDTIDYTVYATGSNITALEFKLVIPEGLEFVAGSGEVPSDLRDGLGFAATDWTEETMKWTAYNDIACNFPSDTVILTFSCVANAVGSYEIEVSNLMPFDETWQEFQEEDTVVDQVTVLSEPEEPTIPDHPSSDDEPEEPTIPDHPSSDDEPEEPTIPEGAFFWATVEASTAEAQVGDTIDFVIYGYGNSITALEFKLDIPQGLGYVSNSAVCPDDLRDLLGWAATDWTESSMKWTGYNDVSTDFAQNTIILTFSCVAEAAGTYQVNVKNLLPFDDNWQKTSGESFAAEVTVTATPEPCAHDYVGNITIAPSCTADGEITYTCSKCGESYTDMVPATGHTKEVLPGYAADCTNPGLTDGAKCSVCGEILTAQEEIPALGHTEEVIRGSTADCATPGLTDGVKCSVCGEILTAQEEIPALGHTEEIIPGSAADCVNTGLTDGAKCSVCGEILTAQEIIPALGHSYEAVVTPPTATEQGYTTYTCQGCGDSYVADYTDALGFTLTGSFVTFRDGAMTLELVKEGEVAYTFTVSGRTGSYELPGVAPGSYILRVSKNLHVTREYQVTVDTNTAPMDVKLHLIGDITGDGRVNAGDVSMAYAHAKKTTLLTGYAFLCADITGDGRVNAGDVSKAYAHAKKTTLLW